MAEDKRTIGVTEAADGCSRRDGRARHFSDGIDAAKFAMALAINSRGERERAGPHRREAPPRSGTSAASIRTANSAHSSTPSTRDVDQPYRLLEFLIDDGLHRVSEHMESVGELDVIALLDEAGTSFLAPPRHRHTANAAVPRVPRDSDAVSRVARRTRRATTRRRRATHRGWASTADDGSRSTASTGMVGLEAPVDEMRVAEHLP